MVEHKGRKHVPPGLGFGIERLESRLCGRTHGAEEHVFEV